MGVEQQDFHRLGHRDELAYVCLNSFDDIHRGTVNRRCSVLWDCDASATLELGGAGVVLVAARVDAGVLPGQVSKGLYLVLKGVVE